MKILQIKFSIGELLHITHIETSRACQIVPVVAHGAQFLICSHGFVAKFVGPWAPICRTPKLARHNAFCRRWAAVISFKLTVAVPRQKLSKSLSFGKNNVRQRLYFLAVRDSITSHAPKCQIRSLETLPLWP